jgi:hypothetical protein
MKKNTKISPSKKEEQSFWNWLLPLILLAAWFLESLRKRKPKNKKIRKKK